MDTYRFDDSFYLYLKKVNNHMIFGHYSLVTNINTNKNKDQFYCERLIFVKELKLIQIQLVDSENCIQVNLEFIDEQGKTKTHNLTDWSSFYFGDFTQVIKYINLLTDFFYSKPLINLSAQDINLTKYNTDVSISKLNEYEDALLGLSCGIQPTAENICVGETFSDGSLKYYYDIKIFDFANKKTFVSFEASEGSCTTTNIYFFTSPLVLKSNIGGNDIYSTYQIEIIDLDDKKTHNIKRLKSSTYSRLNPWIKERLESSIIDK